MVYFCLFVVCTFEKTSFDQFHWGEDSKAPHALARNLFHKVKKIFKLKF